MKEKEYVEDEINLRNYIEVIIKRRRIILAVFFMAVVAAVIVGLLMPRVYQAAASIMIMPSRLPTTLSPTQISLGGDITSAPAISIPTHQTLLKSNIVLKRTIDRLGLTDQQGRPLSVDALEERINVEGIRDTNVLRLEAKENKPEMAKEIANTWIEEYIKYNYELISGEIRGVGGFVVNQFEIARGNLLQAEEAIKNFKDKHKIDLMQAELNLKKEKLNDEKREQLHLSLALKTREDLLKELREQIKGQGQFIIVSKAITDDVLWEKELRGEGLGGLGDRKLRSEEINPIYQTIRTRIVDTEIELNTLKLRSEHLEESIELTRKEIDELERAVNQKEFELTQLTRQEAISQRTFDNLAIRLEEARLAKAMELGEVRIISPATEPERPIRPRKGLMVGISGILSLMFGVFLAFFIEYWQSSKK